VTKSVKFSIDKSLKITPFWVF